MTALTSGNTLHGDDHDISPEAEESSLPLPSASDDLVERRLRSIADAARYTDGTDCPLSEQVRAGADTITSLRAQLAAAEAETVRRIDNWSELLSAANRQRASAEARLATATKALEAAKGFADDEYSSATDLRRKHRISTLCDQIDRSLTDGAKP